MVEKGWENLGRASHQSVCWANTGKQIQKNEAAFLMAANFFFFFSLRKMRWNRRYRSPLFFYQKFRKTTPTFENSSTTQSLCTSTCPEGSLYALWRKHITDTLTMITSYFILSSVRRTPNSIGLLWHRYCRPWLLASAQLPIWTPRFLTVPVVGPPPKSIYWSYALHSRRGPSGNTHICWLCWPSFFSSLDESLACLWDRVSHSHTAPQGILRTDQQQQMGSLF